MAVMVEHSVIEHKVVAAQTARLVLCLASLLLVLLVLVRPPFAAAFGRPAGLRLACEGAGSGQPDGNTVEAAFPYIERRHGFVTVTGEARCMGGQALADPLAVIELRDASGRLLRVERALLNARTLHPGVRATYTVVMSDHAEAAQLRIQFAELRGVTHAARWVTALAKE